MKFLSLFSGIESASVAWIPLGWECVAVAEIEKFPCHVLKHHYPDVPNLGDITKITREQIKELGPIDLIVGGFPCQDVSVAGKRKGLEHNGEKTRSGLFFTAIDIVHWAREECGTRFLLVENVPGLFSSRKGQDFASVLGEMVGAKYPVPRGGWQNTGICIGPEGMAEWCCLDAQFFGVAQRRRRVFALADFGDWYNRPPVLFEQASLSGHPEPSREKREEIAATITASPSAGRSPEIAGGRGNVVVVSPPVSTRPYADRGTDVESLVSLTCGDRGVSVDQACGNMVIAVDEECNAREDLSGPLLTDGQGEPRQAVAIRTANTTANGHGIATKDVTHTLDGANGQAICVHGTQDPCVSNKAFTLGRNNGAENAICFTQNDGGRDCSEEIAPTIRSGGDGGTPTSAICISSRARGDDGRGYGRPEHISEEIAGSVNTVKPDRVCVPAISFQERGRTGGRNLEIGGEISYALTCRSHEKNIFSPSMQVRRLTPLECERLQGFPDNFTLIPGWSNRKPKDILDIIPYIMDAGFTLEEAKDLACTPDGHRYKALGNSMAVPVMAWIGQRIEEIIIKGAKNGKA